MKIFEELKKHHVQDFQEILDGMIFFSSKVYLFMGLLVFEKKDFFSNRRCS